MDVILAALDAALSEQQKRAEGPVPPATLPPPVGPRAVVPPAAQRVAQPAAPTLPAPVQHASAPPLQGMFADGNSLLRAVIAAEVLGPPSALRQAQGRLD